MGGGVHVYTVGWGNGKGIKLEVCVGGCIHVLS